ncbi:hypothetical protein HPB52_012453 [Rhipicephalus sanguineus]|uniref:Uncharacterized protein n=1 Tax=Rhipicephalus sanguineus TaxID=34632 RepID=A0A9D4T9V6_RHISA|nr:hypothetical protein HPB52_012453 [Rhipicephalus sanguineus]
MQRGKTTISAKDPSGDGESGNGDSEGLEAQRNRRPSGDAVAGAAEASSCNRQSLRRHAGNVRARLDQLARLRTLVQQVAEERVRVRNLKNRMLTLQDENVQLTVALNRELNKDPSGDGESGNGDSEGLEAQRNRRPSGDAVAGAAEASSCNRQSLRRHAGNVRARLDQLARLRTLVQQVAEERVRVRNLKNRMLTLQDENVQLTVALNRELNKNPSGDGESGNGDSEGLEAQRNGRPSGDAVVSAAEASSCHRQSLRRHAGNVRTRLDQLARLRTLVQQVAEERVRVRNLKNQMLTLEDENVQLTMALNRKLKKVETLWNETEERKRPPGMSPPRPAPRPAPRLSLHNTVNCQHCSHPVPRAALPLYMDDVVNAGMARHVSSILPFIMPWNMNENDILDFEDFQENLQQYISYREFLTTYFDSGSLQSKIRREISI